MGKIIDLTGMVFDRLSVVSLNRSGSKTYWNCLCICGRTKSVRSDSLRDGSIRSCGCLLRETASKSLSKHRFTCTNKRLYYMWWAMVDRCRNPKVKMYKHYGGRGIKVCPEWEKDCKVFIDWALANGYSDKLSIDRIDNNGNYEPNNCRFITMKDQLRNTSKSISVEDAIKIKKLLKIGGIPQKEIASMFNVHYTRISDIKRGRTYADIIV